MEKEHPGQKCSTWGNTARWKLGVFGTSEHQGLCVSRGGAEKDKDQNQSVPMLSQVSSDRVQMDILSGNFP